jgi:hypothetical protein
MLVGYSEVGAFLANCHVKAHFCFLLSVSLFPFNRAASVRKVR